MCLAACADSPEPGVEMTFQVSTVAELVRAQQTVRDLAPNMTGDLVVKLEAGRYVLDQPLAFDERDSGTHGFHVVYEAAGPPGSVHVIGGTTLADWTPYAGPILTTHVEPGRVFHTLYENGVRADEARYPDRDATLPLARAGYLVSVAGTYDTVEYAGTLPELDVSSLAMVVWSNSGRAWFTDTIPVVSIDRAAHEIKLAHPARYTIGAGARFFLQGSASLLTAPGEFFLDSHSGTLYYWPRHSTDSIVAPSLRTLVSIVGSSPAMPVHDLVLRGLSFEATDFAPWYRFGWPAAGDSGELHQVPAFDRQLEMPQHRQGSITMENTDGVELAFSRIADAGYGGIYLRFANQHDRIYGNAIEHVGINGITVQGGYPGEGDVSHDNVIENNFIHHVGELVGNSAGIDLSNSGDNTVSHDLVQESPRYGIIVHADAATAGELLYAQGNMIDHVVLTDTCQDSGDTAALYVFGVSLDGTTPRVNTFRQIAIEGAIADPSMHDLPPTGVYTDNDSPMQSFDDIGVTGAQGGPYRTNDTTQTFTNVSWLPPFDASAVQFPVLEDDFPAEYRDVN
jgi:hypothetical protein